MLASPLKKREKYQIFLQTSTTSNHTIWVQIGFMQRKSKQPYKATGYKTGVPNFFDSIFALVVVFFSRLF